MESQFTQMLDQVVAEHIQNERERGIGRCAHGSCRKENSIDREKDRVWLKEDLRAELMPQHAHFSDELAKMRGRVEQQDMAARATHIVVEGTPEKPHEPVTMAITGQIIPSTEVTKVWQPGLARISPCTPRWRRRALSKKRCCIPHLAGETTSDVLAGLHSHAVQAPCSLTRRFCPELSCLLCDINSSSPFA